MALIKCPNCQKDVSSMVTYCPFCDADLTHVKVSAAQNSDSYYDPDAGFSLQYPDYQPASGNYENFLTEDPDTDEFSSSYPESQTAQEDPRHRRTDSGSRQNRSGSGSQISSKQERSNTSSSPRQRKRQAPYGRKLLGYRAGNPFYMLVSVCYHMAACVGILYALSFTPQYMADGTMIFHLCRVILAAIMLFLPLLLLTENKIRRKLPFFGSKKVSLVAVGFLILYIPLAALFYASWYFCL